MSSNKAICPECGTSMNHHADKICFGVAGDASRQSSELGGEGVKFYFCPGCGATEAIPE